VYTIFVRTSDVEERTSPFFLSTHSSWNPNRRYLLWGIVIFVRAKIFDTWLKCLNVYFRKFGQMTIGDSNWFVSLQTRPMLTPGDVTVRGLFTSQPSHWQVSFNSDLSAVSHFHNEFGAGTVVWCRFDWLTSWSRFLFFRRYINCLVLKEIMISLTKCNSGTTQKLPIWSQYYDWAQK
jgi:hypothetical protein